MGAHNNNNNDQRRTKQNRKRMSALPKAMFNAMLKFHSLTYKGVYFNRPDMTFAVDWALKTNYISIYL